MFPSPSKRCPDKGNPATPPTRPPTRLLVHVSSAQYIKDHCAQQSYCRPQLSLYTTPHVWLNKLSLIAMSRTRSNSLAADKTLGSTSSRQNKSATTRRQRPEPPAPTRRSARIQKATSSVRMSIYKPSVGFSSGSAESTCGVHKKDAPPDGRYVQK